MCLTNKAYIIYHQRKITFSVVVGVSQLISLKQANILHLYNFPKSMLLVIEQILALQSILLNYGLSFGDIDPLNTSDGTLDIFL